MGDISSSCLKVIYAFKDLKSAHRSYASCHFFFPLFLLPNSSNGIPGHSHYASISPTTLPLVVGNVNSRSSFLEFPSSLGSLTTCLPSLATRASFDKQGANSEQVPSLVSGYFSGPYTFHMALVMTAKPGTSGSNSTLLFFSLWMMTSASRSQGPSPLMDATLGWNGLS